ncbi:MAG: S8 family serine peptidase [bacterium]
MLAVFLVGCQQQPTTAPVEEESTAAGQFQYNYTDHYIVQLSADARPGQLRNAIQKAGGQLIGEESGWDKIGFTVVKGLSEEEALALRKVNGVTNVARDFVVQWIPEISDVILFDQEIVDPESHDPSQAAFFGFQWNMRQIDADDAWAAGFEADPDVLVAILDTGIDPSHIDIAGRVDVGLSQTFVTASPHPPDLTSFVDFNFHGTFVGGQVTTNGIGSAGVAPHATLVAVKVLSAAGSGSFADVISGILYAASIPVDVINMSLGADVPNTPANAPLLDALTAAIEVASDAGVYVVVAAGNDGRELPEVEGEGELLSVPAQSHKRVAAISATAPINQANFDRLASYSNFGEEAISVAAPGGDLTGGANFNILDLVLGPCAPSQISLPFACGPGTYVLGAGTSFAAPHVAGLGALIDSQKGGKLKGKKIKKIVEKTADEVGDEDTHGHGRINVFKALTK